MNQMEQNDDIIHHTRNRKKDRIQILTTPQRGLSSPASGASHLHPRKPAGRGCRYLADAQRASRRRIWSPLPGSAP